jgi:transcriptional regulator with XRE-family HTH domain
MTVTETIRASLLASNDDLTTIGERTGVPISVLSRLATGKTVPSGATIDALADYFGLTLTSASKPGGKTTGTTKPHTRTAHTKTNKRNTRKGN